jgi:hypothetical protein
MSQPTLEPLLVPCPEGRRIIGVANTKWWDLVKSGEIELVKVGGRQMARYSSLKRIAEHGTQPKTAA